MKIVIAPQAFKGCLSAKLVADNIKLGLHEENPELDIISFPIADGGDGTLDVLVKNREGQIYNKEIVGPMGDNIIAEWGVMEDGETAVIEMALASGLALCDNKSFDLRNTTTYGTGELILEAINHGFNKIIIGLGGSATNDGGVGAIQALGGNFYDRNNQQLPYGGGSLTQLDHIDITTIKNNILSTEITIASDVINPLYGVTGASYVFGPQKGGSLPILDELDQALTHYSNVVEKETGNNYSGYAGSGSAGGLAFGLITFTNAVIKPGFELICKKLEFEKVIKDADLIITGEGRTDETTIYNKSPIAISKMAKQYKIPVVCISGSVGKGYEKVINQGISEIKTIEEKALSAEDSIKNAPSYLREIAKESIYNFISKYG